MAFSGHSRFQNVIDLASEVDLRVIGRRSLDHLGRSFAVGDFNNDGRPDLAVGADDSDSTGNVSGQVYVLFGDPTISGEIDLADRIPDVDIWGGVDEGRLGHNMTVADLNGDGIDDLIVLDYNAGPPGRYTAGTSHVFFGGTQTWDRSLIDMTQASADVAIWGAVNGEHAGSVYAVADVNGDDVDDLVLGAPASNRSAERIVNSGAVYVVHGRRDLAGVVDLLHDAALTVRGVAEGGFFGSSVALGDVDGDGAIDLVVGAKGLDRGLAIDAGGVFVFFRVHELSGVVDLADESPGLVLWGSQGQRVGTALAVGDVNGDGQPDLLIGAPTASPGERYRAGMAYLVLGPVDVEQPEMDLPAVADVAFWGPAANARAGETVALWDLGGDGLAEMLVNAPEADVGDRVQAGLLAIWHGQTSFATSVIDLAGAEPDAIVWGADSYTSGAWYLFGSGDLDDSGQLDLLMGITDTRPAGRNGAGTVYGLFDIVPTQPTVSPSSTPSQTPTATEALTPTPPASATATPAATSSATLTPELRASATPSSTSTATVQPTATVAATSTPTSTSTATSTATPAAASYLSLVIH